MHVVCRWIDSKRQPREFQVELLVERELLTVLMQVRVGHQACDALKLPAQSALAKVCLLTSNLLQLVPPLCHFASTTACQSSLALSATLARYHRAQIRRVCLKYQRKSRKGAKPAAICIERNNAALHRTAWACLFELSIATKLVDCSLCMPLQRTSNHASTISKNHSTCSLRRLRSNADDFN